MGTIYILKASVRILFHLVAIGLLFERAIYAKEYKLQLTGVVDVEGLRTALIELNYTVPGFANEHRAVTWFMHEGEVLEPEAGKFPRVELLLVDAPHMSVRVRENGAENTYTIPSGPLSWPGTNRLTLANAALTDTIDILSLLTERIVLFHPKNTTMSPQIQCHWTNSLTTKMEASQALEKSFQTKDTVTILKGNNFLILAPSAVTNEIITTWNSPVAGPSEVTPFVARNIVEGIAKYSELTGRISKAERISQETWFYLRTFKPISKVEAIQSIKTILNWEGYRIIDLGDNAFTIERT